MKCVKELGMFFNYLVWRRSETFDLIWSYLSILLFADKEKVWGVQCPDQERGPPPESFTRQTACWRHHPQYGGQGRTKDHIRKINFCISHSLRLNWKQTTFCVRYDLCPFLQDLSGAEITDYNLKNIIDAPEGETDPSTVKVFYHKKTKPNDNTMSFCLYSFFFFVSTYHLRETWYKYATSTALLFLFCFICNSQFLVFF